MMQSELRTKGLRVLGPCRKTLDFMCGLFLAPPILLQMMGTIRLHHTRQLCVKVLLVCKWGKTLRSTERSKFSHNRMTWKGKTKCDVIQGMPVVGRQPWWMSCKNQQPELCWRSMNLSVMVTDAQKNKQNHVTTKGCLRALHTYEKKANTVYNLYRIVPLQIRSFRQSCQKGFF